MLQITNSFKNNIWSKQTRKRTKRATKYSGLVIYID
jgi:hypothetical protein